MEFTNRFVIPLGIGEAFDVLTDLERVAPCLPGATLENVDGQTYTGHVKVRVGPMSLTYAGEATLVEADRDSHTARIVASGRESRGGGNASAQVQATLEPSADGTLVMVVTDLAVTGKPAQFGRGAMADVGEKLIGRFADSLHDMLASEQTGSASGEQGPPSAGESNTRPVRSGTSQNEVLDLGSLAGGAMVRRIVPVAVCVLTLLMLWRGRAQRRRS